MKNLILAIMMVGSLSAQTFDFSCADNLLTITIQGPGTTQITELNKNPWIYQVTQQPLNGAKFYGWEFNQESCEDSNGYGHAGGLQNPDILTQVLTHTITDIDNAKTVTAIFGGLPGIGEARIGDVIQGAYTGNNYIYNNLVLDSIPLSKNDIGYYDIIKFGDEYAQVLSSSGKQIVVDGGLHGCDYVKKYLLGSSFSYEKLEYFSMGGSILESTIENKTITFDQNFGLKTGDELVWFAAISSNQRHAIKGTVAVYGSILLLTFENGFQYNATHYFNRVHKVIN